jgi:hypothetical protein
MGWGTITNNIGHGTIYNESWTGEYKLEYKFVTIVGDGNDMYKRITDDSGSMEANACLVNTFNNTI